MQTLVQSCTTTKVDTYFGTRVAKEKKGSMQSLALEP